MIRVRISGRSRQACAASSSPAEIPRNRELGMLSAEQLVKSLAGRRIIEDVTLSLRRGEIVGLLGPNGAGKTTTFRMLAGLELPDAGRIRLDGADVTHMEFYARARRGITFLPQDSFVHRSLSVEDNVWIVLEAHEATVETRSQ